ncbi:MAG: hypothetical protein Q7U34_07235 [Anaerolineales bacterium]|nr:hypothetical protein [Anaerolineales bacterium]MDP3185652.1 hypothetical protein [Anaerolineales bacterium]
MGGKTRKRTEIINPVRELRFPGALAGSYRGERVFTGLWTRRILGVVMLAAIVNSWVENLG